MMTTEVADRASRAAAFADIASWVVPVARVAFLHISAERKRSGDPREVVAIIAHRSSPFFALVCDLADAAVRDDIAAAVVPRAVLAESIADVPADFFAVVVALGAEVKTQGVPLELLFTGEGVGRG